MIVSHRFSTVRRADRIVVLERGRVIEDGSHDQLMARGGRYATLFDLQADRYRVNSSSFASSARPGEARNARPCSESS